MILLQYFIHCHFQRMNTFLDKWTFEFSCFIFLAFFFKWRAKSHNLTFSWQFRSITLNTYFCIVYKCVSAIDFQSPHSILKQYLIHCPSASSKGVLFCSKLPTWASMPSFWPLVFTERCYQTTKVITEQEFTWIKHNSIRIQRH